MTSRHGRASSSCARGARRPPTCFPSTGRGEGRGVDSAALAAVLEEFAATVTRDFSLDDILVQLAQAVTRVLSVDGAGVAARDDKSGILRLVYASDGAVRELEQAQERVQNGPCVDSITSGQVINLADVGLEGGWPAYQVEAGILGIRAVATVPLLARGRIWGALDVYRFEPVPLSVDELAAVTTLANLATSYVVVADDRDLALRVQQELAQRAMYDALTSLPVRWVFLEHLSHALDRLRRTPHLVVVLFLDLDGLKYVNDTYGHAAGDQLILTSIERIRSALRPADVLARIGGDEFVVLLEDVDRLKDAAEIAERILSRLSEPSPDGQVIRPAASIGVAATADADTSGATLIAHADSAMYAAKRAGGSRYQVFDPTRYALDRSSAAGREQLARELEAALAADEFEVHYQPIVDLQDSTAPQGLHAVEALVRWRHPQRGMLPADAFIGAAEQCGMLPALGAWVLQAACIQLATWDRELAERAPRRLFVNLSPYELFQPGLVASLAETLEVAGIEPSRLTIEITETGLMQESDASTRTVDALLALGCQLAIDDFGTGYSSLSRVIDIPASTLKIDKAFTLGLCSRADTVAIITAVCVLAQSLQRAVVAEGVEDEETLQRLRDLGVRYVQGFHLARPMPPADLTAEVLAVGHRSADRPG